MNTHIFPLFFCPFFFIFSAPIFSHFCHSFCTNTYTHKHHIHACTGRVCLPVYILQSHVYSIHNIQKYRRSEIVFSRFCRVLSSFAQLVIIVTLIFHIVPNLCFFCFLFLQPIEDRQLYVQPSSARSKAI